MILYFSQIHNWHFLAMLVYGLAWATIFHLISNGFPWSFNDQTCLLNSVANLLLLWLKDALWLLNLALKVVEDSPTYVSALSSDFTSSWYIRFSFKHWPFKGHSSLFLQLQVLGLLLSEFSWLASNCSTLLSFLLLSFWELSSSSTQIQKVIAKRLMVLILETHQK